MFEKQHDGHIFSSFFFAKNAFLLWKEAPVYDVNICSTTFSIHSKLLLLFLLYLLLSKVVVLDLSLVWEKSQANTPGLQIQIHVDLKNGRSYHFADFLKTSLS